MYKLLRYLRYSGSKVRMDGLVAAVYIADAAGAFFVGICLPLLMSDEAYGRIAEIEALFGGRTALIAAVTTIVASASGTAIYIMVHAVARHGPVARRLMRLFVYALPALACGYFTWILMALLGLVEMSASFLLIWTISATTHLVGGVLGIVAIARAPAYTQTPPEQG